MSKEGMTLTVLATLLAEAVHKDEAPDSGGFDLSAGLFGEHVSAWLRSVAAELCPPPIDMVLHCPACGLLHVDVPMSDAQYAERLHESSWWECGGDKPERWTNPPHRSHLCHGCGHIWRPADVPTNGVATVKTKGKEDSPVAGGSLKRAAENWTLLRELLGYVEDSSETLVTIFQDDATREWVVKVGGPSHRQKTFYGASLESALQSAHNR